MEIACPLALMFILVWVRTLVDVTESSIPDMHTLQQAYYPITKLNTATQKFEFI
jgi:hypothetical protein